MMQQGSQLTSLGLESHVLLVIMHTDFEAC